MEFDDVQATSNGGKVMGMLNETDICESRHLGNAESVEAHKTVDKTKGQQDVLDALGNS